MKNQRPRDIFVQPTTKMVENNKGQEEIMLVEYEPTRQGFIQSFVDRTHNCRTTTGYRPRSRIFFFSFFFF